MPSGYSASLRFPTDEYGIGVSAVPDPLDIFTLPQQLGNETLFPSSALITEWAGLTTVNGGLVFKPKGPITVGLFMLRPSFNQWVVGGTRAGFPGLGASFAADSTITELTAPPVPSNLLDVIVSYRLGTVLIGVGAGFAYGLASDVNGSTVGTSDSNAVDSSISWAATGRVGASIPLGPVTLDAGGTVIVGSQTARRVTGATPPFGYAANQDNTLSATNVSFAVSMRASIPLAPALSVIGLGTFALLPQDYSASTAAGSVTTATALIDPSGTWSAGSGVGITWQTADAFLVNGFVSAIVGEGNWVSVSPGTTPRPANSTLWVTIRPLLDGEIKVFTWLTVRAGIAYSARLMVTTTNAGAGGTASTAVKWETEASVSAGWSIQATNRAVLEVLTNISALLPSAVAGAPYVEAALKMDL